MQGEKIEQEELFIWGSLEELVPADDPFRRLEAILDLAWLRRETSALYSSTGRPSIDPVVVGKLLVIAICAGISSERELMRQVRVNLSYRRFLHYGLGEALPDHSSLTRSRQRMGEVVVQKLYEYVLQLCVDAHLVGGDLASIDSTFVHANASLQSLRPRLVKVEAKAFTEQLFRQDALPGMEHDGDRQDPPPGKRGRPRLNDAVVSITDPECGLDRRRGSKARLGFYVHFVVDRARQIITGVEVNGAQHRDAPQLLPLVDQVLERGIEINAVVADRGYSSAEVYHGLAERGIEAFIPQVQRGAERQGRYGQDAFRYEPEADRYRCPNGAFLVLRRTTSGERTYRARVRDCTPCPLRALCTTGKVRTLTIHRYEDDLAAARRLQATTRAKRAARDRRICSERSFAEAKELHGLRDAHWRGLVNLRTQALLTATAMNLKRYLKAQTRVFPGAQAARITRSIRAYPRWPALRRVLIVTSDCVSSR